MRRRSSVSSSSTLADLADAPDVMRDPDLWFPNGDLVLVARRSTLDSSKDKEDLPPFLAFKVHASVLQRQSRSMRSLLSHQTKTARRINDGEVPKMDEVPVVEFPECAEDLHCFLSWVYLVG